MINRLASRHRPSGKASGYQRWRELLFLHWMVDPKEISTLLPKGLSLDLFDGQAFVGIVPFRMEGVRPRWAPEIFSFNFLETNLRTYVIHNGEPGVYFFSLEAASRIAVWVARLGWSLPYYYADMDMRDHDLYTLYRSSRPHSPTPDLIVEYRVDKPLPESMPESLEFFLLERYLLFAQRRGQLWRGQVHHSPYPIFDVKLRTVAQHLTHRIKLPISHKKPSYCHYSPGVDVEVFSLVPC